MKRTLAVVLISALLLCGCAAPTHSTSTIPEASRAPTDAPTLPVQTEPPTQAPTEPSAPPPVKPLSKPKQILAQMDLRQKVGQIFLARCPDAGAVSSLEQYPVAGYVLFDRDFKYKAFGEAQQTIASYQNASEVPLLIAVDEEGGGVTRISCHPQYRDENFPSPRRLYAAGGIVQIANTESEKCDLLRSLGVNVNLAPVCDVTTDPDAFMYYRSLGESPETTATFIRAVVTVMANKQVGSVLKHFPGYGNNTDTHTGVAVDDRSLESLEECDLIPFSAGIQAGCGAIMVSHTIVSCLDQTLPASLSPAVHAYLRESMGYSGVIMTDDLAMQAVTDLYGDGEAAVLAVLAGNDLICCSYYQNQFDAVLEAVEEGRITEAQIDEAALRVLQWKEALGLLG